MDDMRWREFEKFAMHELELAGFVGKKAPYGGMLAKAELELLYVFHKQQHSEMSAELVANLFKDLALYKPITPLQCTDDEWVKDTSKVYQNKRLSLVFKDDKGPHFLEAIKFVDPSGYGFFGRAYKKDGTVITSHQYFKPPLMPKTFIVHVDNKNIIIDENELIPVFEMYIKPDNLKLPTTKKMENGI
jgi:hypothetical protein